MSTPAAKKSTIPLFSTFGKGSKDLLTKGFPSTYKVEVTTAAENGVSFVTSAERKKRDEKVPDSVEFILGTFQEKYKLPSRGLEFTGTIDTDNALKGELSLDDLLPGLKTILKGTGGSAQEVEGAFEYKHEFGTCTSSLLWNAKGSKVVLGASATVGRQGFSAGLETKYQLNTSGKGGNLEFVTAAVNYKGSALDVTAFAKSEAPKKDTTSSTDSGAKPRALTLGASVLYSANKDTTLATTVDYDLQKPAHDAVKVKFGGSHNLDADTTGKARFDTEGKLALSVARQLNPHVKATLGTELNTFDLHGNQHKFGFLFELKA